MRFLKDEDLQKLETGTEALRKRLETSRHVGRGMTPEEVATLGNAAGARLSPVPPAPAPAPPAAPSPARQRSGRRVPRGGRG